MILQTRLPDGQEENKILREVAKKVGDIKSAEIKTLISRMAEAMFNEPDGIGIAAPQIGESLQIFLVSGEVLHLSTAPPSKGWDPRKNPLRRTHRLPAKTENAPAFA